MAGAPRLERLSSYRARGFQASVRVRYVTMDTHTPAAEDVDLDTLRDLNHAYLQSVVNGDVDCFRRILAADFLCSNPDGALLDKQQFLERTSGPRTLA